MVIRESQLDTFRAAGAQQFDEEMIEHLTEFAPELARVAGRPGLQKAVQLGSGRAAAYGFSNRGPVRLYLEMMCSFGAGFDTDPQYPWARAALQDARYQGQTRRASELYRASERYFDEVAGPGDIHARTALKNARRIVDDASSGELVERILAGFKTCYPQKYEHAGEPALRMLVFRALQLAEGYGIKSDRHRALIAAVLYGFGHDAITDPLYPWIGGALNDTLVADPEDRAERLYSRLVVYVDHMLQTLG